MVFVIATLLGIGAWLIALLLRAVFTWAVTARYQRKYGTPERLAQVRAPLDAILSGVVDEPVRFAALWWVIAVSASGVFTLTATTAPDGAVLVGLLFATGWAGAEIVHLAVVVATAARSSDEHMRQQFKASGLTDPKTVALRVGAALLRNFGLTLILVVMPILVLVTLTARAAVALLAVRRMVNAVEEQPQDTLLTSGFLAGAIFAVAGGVLVLVS